jgi:cytochrome c2
MKFLTILVSILFLTACNSNNKKGYLAMVKKNASNGTEFSQEHPGKKLMENNCYACHNPETSEEAMIAPPMIAVKMHYISEDTSKEDFVAAMVDWCKNPSKEKSKMPGAIKKFGLMPYQFYPENTIRQIADYMFDNEVEEPEWFQAHYKKMHGNRQGK